MNSMSKTTRSVRWESLSGDGIEHLDLTLSEAGAVAVGTVVGRRNAARYGLRYEIRCDPAWCVREVIIDGTTRPELHLLADGNGHWREAAGDSLSALDGCIDIDIAATPFTNTLPIRRMDLAAGDRREIRVAYVRGPGAAVAPAEQAYTCIEPMQRYRYESLSSGFSVDVTVDADGLVVDYPGLFRRRGGECG
jgi:hypothetical protein